MKSDKGGALLPERLSKKKDELAAMKEVQRCAEDAMSCAISAIRQAEVRDGVLYYEGKSLLQSACKGWLP